ncbi:hypothetical protein CIG75_02630 [Tumebacillus algifaecis]|uniref:KAP NTPase domain-containing protein n=1 Tax=Tumebacillus algifaecis TaxID=1214604 RepID=A0A223CXQ7_9BACL|nr:hypothetical protein [Tumebacillus algifaecis]ASS73985.1 hypothetical protein CIG75_02630 [Tumebacillus algifaecis]
MSKYSFRLKNNHKEVNKKSVKIGSRVLTDGEAKSILPSFEKIGELLRDFRNASGQLRDSNDTADNCISILGGRGSGKTSVMLTFKAKHEEKYSKRDIVLPLIVPENMSPSNDTLGWLLGQFENVVAKLDSDSEDRMKAGNKYDELYDRCIKSGTSSLKDRFDDLRKSYVFRKEEYYRAIHGRHSGAANYIKDNENFIHSDHNFIERFRKFIDQLIVDKRGVLGGGHEPLILIYFDDVDLCGERCPDVLDTVRNYLNHPNIVVFVSGDYDQFTEAITMDFVRREKIGYLYYNTNFVPDDKSSLLRSDNAQEKNALQLRKVRAQDYLKKVMPPTLRFEMKRLATNKEKSNFEYVVHDISSEKPISLRELLENIHFSGNTFGEINKEVTDVFFAIFDDNPRGLINPYYFLYQRNIRENSAWDANDLKQFVELLINSTSRLKEYEFDLRNIIEIGIREAKVDSEASQKAKIDPQQTSLNYNALEMLWVAYENKFNEMDSSLRSTFSEDRFYNDMLMLTIFIEFIERLMKLENTDFSVVDKNDPLMRVLNKFNRQKKLYPEKTDMNHLIKMFLALERRMHVSNTRFLFDNQGSDDLELNYYLALSEYQKPIDGEYEDAKRVCELVNLLHDTYDVDEEWVVTHLGYLFEKGRNIEEYYLSFAEKMRIHLKSFMDDKKLLDIVDLELRIGIESEQKFEQVVRREIIQIVSTESDLADLDSEHARLEQLLEYHSNRNNRETLRDQLKSKSIQLQLMEHEIEQTKKELSVMTYNELIAIIQKRKDMLERINFLDTFLKNRKEDWEVLESRIIVSDSLLEGVVPISTFDPQQLPDKTILSESDWSVIVKEPLIYVYPQSGQSLTQSTMTFIDLYFCLKQEFQLLKKYLPIDYQARLDALDRLNKEMYRLENEITKLNSLINGLPELLVEDANISREDLLEQMVSLWKLTVQHNLKESLSIKGNRVLKKDDMQKALQVFEQLIAQGEELLKNSRNKVISLSGEVRTAINILRKIPPLRESIERISKQSEVQLLDYQRLIKELEFYLKEGRGGLARSSPQVHRQIDVIKKQLTTPGALREDDTTWVRSRSLQICIAQYAGLIVRIQALLVTHDNDSDLSQSFFCTVKDELRKIAKKRKLLKTNFERYVENQLSEKKMVQ